MHKNSNHYRVYSLLWNNRGKEISINSIMELCGIITAESVHWIINHLRSYEVEIKTVIKRGLDTRYIML